MTDHKTLTTLLTKQNLTPRMARWAAAIQGFDLTIKYNPGSMNGAADCLSRNPVSPAVSPAEIDQVFATQHLPDTNYISALPPIHKWRELQQADTKLGHMIDYLDSGRLPTDKIMANHTQATSHLYHIEDDVLYFIDIKQQQVALLCVPDSQKQHVLYLAHDHLLSSHYGRTKTFLKIRQQFFWNGMYKDVRIYCDRCHECNRLKGTTHPNKAKITPLPLAFSPYARAHLDAIGPLMLTENGNKHILVFSCPLTKWVEAYAVPRITAQTTAHIFITAILCRFGCMEITVSDRALNYCGEIMTELHALLGIRHITTSSYHPEANGSVERANGTIVKAIRMYCSDKQSKWDNYLPFALFAYRNSVHATTGLTPYYMMFGHQCTLPLNTALRYSPPKYQLDYNSYAQELVSRLSDAWQFGLKNWQLSNHKITDRSAAAAKGPELEIGSIVYYRQYAYPVGSTHKLCPRYSGPFVVQEIKFPNIKIAKDDPTDPSTKWVHYNQVKVLKTIQESITDSKPTPKTVTFEGTSQQSNPSTHDYNLRPRK